MKYKKDKTKLLQIRVSDSDIDTLDQIAAKEKRTRSDVIRLLIANGGISYGTTTKKAI